MKRPAWWYTTSSHWKGKSFDTKWFWVALWPKREAAYDNYIGWARGSPEFFLIRRKRLTCGFLLRPWQRHSMEETHGR